MGGMAEEEATVVLSREDFLVLHEALQRNCLPFSHEDVPELLRLLATAWKLAERIGQEVGISSTPVPSDWDPAALQ